MNTVSNGWVLIMEPSSYRNFVAFIHAASGSYSPNLRDSDVYATEVQAHEAREQWIRPLEQDYRISGGLRSIPAEQARMFVKIIPLAQARELAIAQVLSD